ncbi:MAG: type II toxin-antitoxin system RelE/ParE family toxin [Coxiellaceae bacterium]|nr:type II toxin-antitoxin system RelE/ParE family toxin [Coxiellaceae bacterium]
MIISWQHKGLKAFYDSGSTQYIQTNHRYRLTIILQHLNAATLPTDMNLPGMKFHRLKGKLKNFYAVSVNGNWRVTFTFKGKHAALVNYIDYH